MDTPANYRTMAEYFIQGITGGFVEAAEVIAWSDEIVVSAPKAEDWMLEISSASPDDRMGVLHQLHAVQGEIQPEVLERLLAAKK
jgi:glycine cleavage system H lipoate-binding protein